MRSVASRLAAVAAALALCACAASIQPRPSPRPFRGEFPQLVGPAYDVQPDPGYGPPPYAGEPAYGYDDRAYDERAYGYGESGYAAAEDYHWYSADEYRRGARDYRGHGDREYREYAPDYREHAPPHHGGHAEYSERHSEYTSGHEARYTYKYRIRTRVIKLGRPHLKKIESYGAARPAAHEYSYDEVRYEKPAVKHHKKILRKKARPHTAHPVKTCTCTQEKRVENVRRHVQDERVKIERYGEGYRLEMPAEILFALDSDVVKPDAQAIIRRMAGGLMSERGAEIDVNGYTDTSGSEEHNDLLSQSRAVAVADALVRQGVDAAVVNPRGFGESVLAVDTPDGVREPLNRRVEILVMPAQS